MEQNTLTERVKKLEATQEEHADWLVKLSLIVERMDARFEQIDQHLEEHTKIMTAILQEIRKGRRSNGAAG